MSGDSRDFTVRRKNSWFHLIHEQWDGFAVTGCKPRADSMLSKDCEEMSWYGILTFSEMYSKLNSLDSGKGRQRAVYAKPSVYFWISKASFTCPCSLLSSCPCSPPILILLSLLAGCLDRLFICPAWARKGYCESKRKLMQKHCPHSCDFCYSKGTSFIWNSSENWSSVKSVSYTGCALTNSPRLSIEKVWLEMCLQVLKTKTEMYCAL